MLFCSRLPAESGWSGHWKRCKVNWRKPLIDHVECGGIFALLAAVSKTVPLLFTVPYLSLPDIPHRFCQLDGVIHRTDSWSKRDPAAQRLPVWPIYPRRRSGCSSEEGRDADDGRSAHHHCHCYPYIAVV